MRSPHRFHVLLALAIVVGPLAVRAQTAIATPVVPRAASAPAKAGTAADSATTRRIVLVKSTLRNLVVAQERYYSEHGTYTTDAAALGFFVKRGRGQRRTDSVAVQVAFAGGRGWTGIGHHIAMRGKSCVVYVGIESEIPLLPKTANDTLAPEEEGMPTCDQP